MTGVADILDWARQQGCVEAHVDAYAKNDGAQRFYERNGYSSIEPDTNERAFYYFQELRAPS